jgi:trk system potassium uptake protein
MKTNIGKKIRSGSTAHLLAISFLSVIVLGTFVLMLPISTYEGIHTVDAAFISVSAVCVTGLATVNVSTCFTLFGQVIIMILIQIGGLGIMTFAACAVWLLREKLSVNEKMILEYSFIQGEDAYSLKKFVFFIMRYTFAIESIGAVCYFFAFSDIKNIGLRLFYSIFHSVSSFCNAGFSLFPDNFMRYDMSLGVNLITCSLIILGGLGFIVIFEIRNKLTFSSVKNNFRKRYKTRLFTVHTWLVLRVTVSLIVGGTIAIYLLQFASTGVTEKISVMDAFFQSVSCRTAGFNTVDIGALHASTLIAMMFLMFIGGSPGSTAGGIKTTTFGVLLYIIVLGRNNFESVTIRGRTIPYKIIYQALLVLLFSIFIVFIAVVLLSIFEPGCSFIQLLFETISAFGTVGLSTGITSHLVSYSKCVLIITMFVGRIGSLTIFSIIASNRDEMKVKYVEERVLIG